MPQIMVTFCGCKHLTREDLIYKKVASRPQLVCPSHPFSEGLVDYVIIECKEENCNEVFTKKLKYSRNVERCPACQRQRNLRIMRENNAAKTREEQERKRKKRQGNNSLWYNYVA